MVHGKRAVSWLLSSPWPPEPGAILGWGRELSTAPSSCLVADTQDTALLQQLPSAGLLGPTTSMSPEQTLGSSSWDSSGCQWQNSIQTGLSEKRKLLSQVIKVSCIGLLTQLDPGTPTIQSRLSLSPCLGSAFLWVGFTLKQVVSME